MATRPNQIKGVFAQKSDKEEKSRRKNLTKIFHKKGNLVLIKDILVLKDILQKYSNGQYWASPLPPKGLPLAGFKFHGESNCITDLVSQMKLRKSLNEAKTVLPRGL